MISEVEFFAEIFEDFLYLDNRLYGNDLWKSYSIIKLMQISNELESKEIIEEGLKIIVNLSKFKECGELWDSYEINSYPVNELMDSEKTLLESILRAEFT
ncbi:MAG: hypothetical protein ACFE9Z_00070 [Promethearchaeota archaeon]